MADATESESELRWKSWTAEARFSLSHDVCLTANGGKAIALPAFHAAEDADLAWRVQVQVEPSPLWGGSCHVARKLAISLAFKSEAGAGAGSGGGRELVLAKVIMDAQPSIAASECADHVQDRNPPAGVTVSKRDFQMNKRFVFKLHRSPILVGRLLVLNRRDVSLKINVQVRLDASPESTSPTFVTFSWIQ